MKLTVGQDLQPVYDLVFRVKRNFPHHFGNIKMVIHNVDRYIGQYNNNLWQYSRKPCDKYRDAAQQDLDNLAALLTVLERAEMMGYLSGESRQRDGLL